MSRTIYNENKQSRLVAISMFVMVAYPILSYYQVFVDQLTYASFASLLLFVANLNCTNKSFRRLPNTYVVYWFYLALQIYFVAGIGGWSDYLPGGINFIIFSLALYTFANNFDQNLATKYLKWIFIFASALLIYQILIYYGMHRKISCFLPIGNNLTYVDTLSELRYLHTTSLGDHERFSSIFAEPSHFAQYSLVLLAIELFKNENKEKLYTKFSLYIVAVIFLIQSGAGLLGLFFIYLIKFLYVTFITRKSKYYFALAIIIPLFLYIGQNYLSSSSGAYVSERMMEMADSSDYGQTNSTFVRIYYGWYRFGELSTLDKVFGTSRETLSKLRGDEGGFLNGVTTVLCLQGIVGAFLLFRFYIQCCRKSTVLSIVLTLLFLLISLFGATYLSGLMLIFTTYILGIKYSKR